MNPLEYRRFELNTGEDVNVPIPKRKMITRSSVKKKSPTKQQSLNFPVVKKLKKIVNSTPTKKQGGGNITWSFYK